MDRFRAPGRQTSEFWIFVAWVVLIIANGTDYVTIPWDQISEIGLLVGIYTGGRSAVKAVSARSATAGDTSNTAGGDVERAG